MKQALKFLVEIKKRINKYIYIYILNIYIYILNIYIYKWS